jgi:magnesium transporter
MANKLISLKTLKHYVNQKDVKKIRRLFDQYPLIDLAHLIDQLAQPEALLFIFRTCNSDHTAELFTYLSPEQQTNLIHSFTDKQLLTLLTNSFSDDIADFLEDMPANLVSRILKVADASTRQDINLLLNYKPGTAGSIMTTEYITIPEQATINEALAKIRQVGKQKETIYSSFVVNDKRILKGVVYIEDIVFNQGDVLVQSIMNQDFLSCKVTTDQEEVAQLFKRYDLSVIPVLNESNHFVGIITIDDIVDVIESEASEDILKLAKVNPLETPYTQASAMMIAKKSIPWLILLLVLGALSGFILNQFEEAFKQVAILAAFIPMLMDTGGNAGNQSATLVIRGIALNEIHFPDFKKVFLKEFRVAALVGLSIASFGFLWITGLIAIGFLTYDSIQVPGTWLWFLDVMKISGVVSLTLFFAIMIAKLVGSVLPLLAVRFKKDPAVMASPFVTTIVDVSALLIYFFLANFLFQLF